MKTNAGLSFMTRFGWVTTEVAGGKLMKLSFLNKNLNFGSALLLKLKNDLAKYFEGAKVDFRPYKVELSNFTNFERNVLNATKELCYGETITYGNLAKKIGYPNAQRAVGSALSKNNVPIIIPCHRVVGANGIGGFSLGLDLKMRLLALESVRI